VTRIPILLLAALPCLAAETLITEADGRFSDEPSMARAADGSLYVAWNGFRGGTDALMVARYEFRNGQFRKLGSWEALGGKGSSILGPKVVTAGDGVYMLYASEKGRAWNIVAMPCNASGPGRAVAVTSDAAVNVKPDGAWRNGTLWVAWETNAGNARSIRMAAVRGASVGKAEAVSTGRSNYGPSIAVESNGTVNVAWHGFREDNYDVFLRRRAASGEWSAERRISTAPSLDRHAAVALRGDDVWVFWENAQAKGYRTGNSLERKIVAAKIGPKGLETPRAFGEASKRGEAAAPVFDSTGRLWLAYLSPRMPNVGWEVWFTGFNGEGWTAASAVTKRKGMDRRPALVVDGETAVLAFQVDNNIGRPATIEESAKIESGIVLASVDLKGMPKAAGSMALAPLEESTEPFEAGQLRVQFGEDRASPAIAIGGKKLRLLYGDLHTHSDISVCARCTNQSVDENYQMRRDLHNLDFACMTDHGYNQTEYLWNYTAKMARANEDPGRLMTFLGQEWTSEFKRDKKEEYPYGYYGHRNLILADPYFPRWWNAHGGGTPADLWADLAKMKANYVNIPHQIADTGNVPTAWNFNSETSQPVAEIFQARGSYEHFETPRQALRAIPKPGWFLQDAWAKGIVIGVIASPDHAGGLGKACVWAPAQTREAILDAIRARHTYGTTAARIALEVRVNGRLMGDKIAAVEGKPVEVVVRADCPGDIDRVEVCRNNQFVYTQRPQGRKADFTFVDTAPVKGTSYYYVRVMQKDEEIAWSSPVWLNAK
jgi:hypothetical protein